MNSLIGKSVTRVEDFRFLTGRGRYTDDLQMENFLHAVFIRSPHAHARIKSVNLNSAKNMQGVRYVLHGEALAKAGVQPIDTLNHTGAVKIHNKDGTELPDQRRWPLARKKVRFVGEPVAVVVAQSLFEALDATEAIEIEYEVLDSVIEIDNALQSSAPLVWDELTSNVCADHESGDRTAVDKALATADKVVSVDVEYPRHIVAFMEPRSVIAKYNTEDQTYQIYTGGQSPHWIQASIAELLMEPVDKVRAILPDSGGGFGARTWTYPEMAVLAFLAKMTNSTVKWVPERWESFVSDTQSRDHRIRISLSLDKNCKVTGLRLSSIWRIGAYLAPRSAWLHATYMALVASGAYRIPAIHYELLAVFTNTATVAAFRGVGRAETSYALERAMDEAARQLNMSVIEFRKINLLHSSELPWLTPTGANYDAGDYARNLELLLEHVDLEEYTKRCEQSRYRGLHRGMGYSVFVDSVGGAPNEFAEIRVVDEIVEVRVGTKSIGTSHETVFVQVLASQLGIAMDKIRFIEGDTGLVKNGSGTHASRSLRYAGTAIVQSADKLLDQAKELAAEMLEVRASDLQYREGTFQVPGTDHRVNLFEIARIAQQSGNILQSDDEYVSDQIIFVSGAQVCEVEVDPETGRIVLDRFITVSDPGVVVNPMVAEGQVHGGVANGVGHALLEHAVYDSSDGQLLTGSFLDYAIPRADDLPMIECLWNAIPTQENPLGVKGVGEIGITGAPAAIMNAVYDALKEFGNIVIQMPATPERVWQAIRQAKMKLKGKD